MWSGPRNISTAMMRSWENRSDTVVVDEPFYAYYLQETGADHPLRERVVAAMATDWETIATDLTAGPTHSPIFYQKHMTHHMLPGCDMSWAGSLTHCFLIRDPLEVVNSYVQARGTVSTSDIGIVRQTELFDEITELIGREPPIVDARDVLTDPRSVLSQLCNRLSVPFEESMLSWPSGPRPSDGVWAPHWYANVERSTGFMPYRPRTAALTDQQRRVAELSRPHYDRLHAMRLMI